MFIKLFCKYFKGICPQLQQFHFNCCFHITKRIKNLKSPIEFLLNGSLDFRQYCVIRPLFVNYFNNFVFGVGNIVDKILLVQNVSKFSPILVFSMIFVFLLRVQWKGKRSPPPSVVNMLKHSNDFTAGVIWKGDKLIDGVPETLDMLRSKVQNLIF